MRSQTPTTICMGCVGQPGFTLVEMLVVMATLAVVLAIGTATLLGAFQGQRIASASLQRLISQNGLADQFRADVGQAVSAPERVETVTATPTCLILRRPDGRHIIYRWAGHHLERSELGSAGATQRQVPVGPGQMTVEFNRSGPEQRIISLRLKESWGRGETWRPLEISAALGGDLQ